VKLPQFLRQAANLCFRAFSFKGISEDLSDQFQTLHFLIGPVLSKRIAPNISALTTNSSESPVGFDLSIAAGSAPLTPLIKVSPVCV
jgi:hypothetical protein